MPRVTTRRTEPTEHKDSSTPMKRKRTSGFVCCTPKKMPKLENLQDAAASVIQRRWRAYMKHKVTLEDPITFEPIRGLPFTFVSKHPPYSIHKFDARILAEYFDNSIKFVNPLTQEPFNAIEVARLQSAVSRNPRFQKLTNDFAKRETLAAALQEQEARIDIHNFQVDEILGDLINYSIYTYEKLESMIMLSYDELTAIICDSIVDDLTTQLKRAISIKMHQRVFPEARRHVGLVACIIANNPRISPDTIELFCSQRIEDIKCSQRTNIFIANASENSYIGEVIADIIKFLQCIKQYYATKSLQKLQQRHDIRGVRS